MRIRLEGNPEELPRKAPEILRRLAEAFAPSSPESARVLEFIEKAEPTKEPQLKHPALRGIQRQMKARYNRQMKAMLRDIGSVLDRSLKKSEGPTDHSQVAADQDEKQYEAVKAKFFQMGYSEEDFLAGGQFHGVSTNQLIDLYREKADANKGLLEKADGPTPAEQVKRARLHGNVIPTMWQLQDQLRRDGKLPDGLALSFFCPVYFAGQTIVDKLLDLKDEYGEMMLFSLPAITDQTRIKLGLRQMELLGIRNPERLLGRAKEGPHKGEPTLKTFSILPGYEGVASEHRYQYIAQEAVQLGAFSIVPEEWLNAGDPYNQSYRFPGEDGYSPYWRVPPWAEFQKLRPDLARQFRETEQGVAQKPGAFQKSETLPRLRNIMVEDGKATKEQSAYLHVLNVQYECKECEHFIPDDEDGRSRCIKHKPKDVINAWGSCRLWSLGAPAPGRKPASKTDTVESGYRENEYKTGFRCSRCEFFIKSGDCQRVDKGSAGADPKAIHPEAHCALWRVVHDVPVPIEVKKADRIPGGLAAGRDPKDFNQTQLADGLMVEMEHTSDLKIAREIAMDHLTEDPDYYKKKRSS